MRKIGGSVAMGAAWTEPAAWGSIADNQRLEGNRVGHGLVREKKTGGRGYTPTLHPPATRENQLATKA